MPTKIDRLRKAYEFKLGKDLAAKLTDAQIKILSSYYNSMSESEQNDVDNKIAMGKSNDLLDMALSMVEENESEQQPDSSPPENKIKTFSPDLDDLLNSIRDEGKRERALALYEGTREDDLVEEEIDERILRLLGLEDTFDIDYDTYKTLLKEANIKYSVIGTKDIPTDEVMLLQEELKRVRKKVGRFKLKKKKITADDFGSSDAITKEKKQQYYLSIIPEAEVSGEESKEKTDRLLENIITIRETVESILDKLKGQVKLEKDTAELERKREQIAKRNRRESELEKKKQKKGGALGAIAKVFSPIQGVLNSIFRFLAYSILGRAFRSFIDWFSDEKNKKKVDTIVRFLKDWWPAILGALFLFTNPFGRFIRAFIGTVLKLTLRLTKFAIPKLLSFAKKNPAVAAALAGATAVAAGAVVPKLFPETVDAEERKTEAAPGSKEEKIEALKKQKENLGFLEKLQGVGSEIDEQINQLETGRTKSYGFKGGGEVSENKISAKDIRFDGGGVINSGSGLKISGAGSDTQLVAATPGEIVISKRAVDAFGADTFLGMNEMGGGTNKPSTINNIQFAAGGGMVGKKKTGDIKSSFNLPSDNFPRSKRPFSETSEKKTGSVKSALNKAQKFYNNISVGNSENNYSNKSSETNSNNFNNSRMISQNNYLNKSFETNSNNSNNNSKIISQNSENNYSNKSSETNSNNSKNSRMISQNNYLNKSFETNSNNSNNSKNSRIISQSNYLNKSFETNSNNSKNSRIISQSNYLNKSSETNSNNSNNNSKIISQNSENNYSNKSFETNSNNSRMISQNIVKSNSYPVNYYPNENYSRLQLASDSKINMMIPGPLPSGSSSSFIPLPDIVQSLPSQQMGVNDGTKIPEFIGSPFSDKASINAGIYGIV